MGFAIYYLVNGTRYVARVNEAVTYVPASPVSSPGYHCCITSAVRTTYTTY